MFSRGWRVEKLLTTVMFLFPGFGTSQCVGRFIFGINGEEHQLSSVINIVTFDGIAECETDAHRGDCFKTNKRQS